MYSFLISGLEIIYTRCIVAFMEGSEIKEQRKRLDLTQEGLAKALGVSTNTVARWERDEVPTPSYLELALKQLKAERKKD